MRLHVYIRLRFKEDMKEIHINDIMEYIIDDEVDYAGEI